MWPQRSHSEWADPEEIKLVLHGYESLPEEDKTEQVCLPGPLRNAESQLNCVVTVQKAGRISATKLKFWVTGREVKRPRASRSLALQMELEQQQQIIKDEEERRRIAAIGNLLLCTALLLHYLRAKPHSESLTFAYRLVVV
jgi:hypothetical protein